MGIYNQKHIRRSLHTTVKEVPTDQLPRERLLRDGSKALSDLDLLAAIIGSGVRGRGVFTLAAEVLNTFDSKSELPEPSDLEKIVGLGKGKVCAIVAALEFARRRIRPEGTKIREPKDVYPLIRHIADRKQEHFLSISLNGAHEVIAIRTITVGLVNAAQVHPREVYSDLITDRACSLIVAHNHPSGDLTPSKEDLAVTTRLKDAGKILGLELLDHLIFSYRGFISLRERNEIF